MKRIMVRAPTNILPFNEPARELRILNKPLWLQQRDLMARYCKGVWEVDDLAELPTHSDEPLLVCRDNLYFNADLLDTFVTAAQERPYASQIAFALDDRAINTHALPLQSGIRREGDVYVADMFYYPAGALGEPRPLTIDTLPYEIGYYHIPGYMAPEGGDLVYQAPQRVLLSIENWVHLFIATVPYGMLQWARKIDAQMQRARLRDIRKWQKADVDALLPKLRLAATATVERLNPFEERWRNHFLACKELVKVGKNCSIDPTATIHGPTVIGDNVYIGPGVVIANSLIGNNVNIMQGSQVMLSVISDRCFLPFNSGVFKSCMMENSMIAQNTTLQMCVVGRNTFIGANNVFTDFNLMGEPIRTYHEGTLQPVALPVLGSAVGHNTKIGSGFVFYPGRMIGSNTVLVLKNRVNLVRKSINVPGIPAAYNISGEGYAYPSDDGVERTVYHWPYLVDQHNSTLVDPFAQLDTGHTTTDQDPPKGRNGTTHEKPAESQTAAAPGKSAVRIGG